MTIRGANNRDIEQWINLRQQLWPDCSLEEHNFEVSATLSSPKDKAFLAVDTTGRIMGFIELSIRSYAEGCESRSVGYVEGMFVTQENRRGGISQELFQAGEHWALKQGCFEMASDCDIINRKSLLSHQKAGFREIERSIHFKKSPLLQAELDAWCLAQTENIYSTYLESSEPWRQSGFSGPEERWVACRKPIADCIIKSGSFLDIGCANGYLLESVLHWTRERGIEIDPYGIDISEPLLAVARGRLSEYKENIHLGNGFTWHPKMRFDYVRTELCYVPNSYRKAFLNRLVTLFLKIEGSLLVAEYHSENDPPMRWESKTLKEMGFRVPEIKSGVWKQKELTRISALPRKLNA